MNRINPQVVVLPNEEADQIARRVFASEKRLAIGINTVDGKLKIEIFADKICPVDAVGLLLQTAEVIIETNLLPSDNSKQVRLSKAVLANLAIMQASWNKTATCDCDCNPSKQP